MSRVLNIVGITPNNTFTGETPEQVYLRKLGERGHKVIVGEAFSSIPRDTDIVVAMSEVSCENAFKLSNAYDKPFYAHMEWLPYWRVMLEPENAWGYDKGTNLPYATKMNFIRAYQQYLFYWSMAQVKSLAADCFHQSVKDFVGIQDMRIKTKRLGIDTDKLITHALSNTVQPTRNNSVCCISRFVPHKRIHHVIEALISIKFTGTLNLIGYGSERELYDSYCTSFKVDYHDSKDKYTIIEKSTLVVSLWSGIVPAEAMFLGTPAISYDSPYMREMWRDSIEYAENNNIIALGELIKKYLNIEDAGYRAQIASKGASLVCDSVSGTTSMDKALDLLESFLYEAIKVKGVILR